MNHALKRICVLTSMALPAAAPSLAGAAGFALLEQNASGLGNAYAGSAAVANDASTIFYNPAGLSLLPGPQVSASAAAIYLQSEFSGSASQTQTPAAFPPFIPNVTVQPGTNNGGNAGGWSVVPSLYVSAPIGDRWAVGLGAGAPFGLKTQYDSNWKGRFLGVTSELTSININPSVAFKVNDKISLGAGVNWQRTDVTLTNATLIPGGEGTSTLNASDDAWGWNIGALFKLGTDMRLGVSYRSALDYTLSGTANVTTPTGAALASLPATADIKLPDMALISVVQQFGDKWQLLGDLQYTNWSTVGTINVTNPNNGQRLDTLALNFNNAWRIAVGVNYFSNEKWTIRGGMAWDQSPVDDQNRTVRLPDNDRYWLTLGTRYKFGKGGALDVSYAHLFIQSANINQSKTTPLTGTPLTITNTVSGSYDNSVDIIGVQLTWTF